MSKTLDERVVSMRFDNSDFEKNANTSLGTLEKLKRSLNFSGASKGLENVSNAAGRCNLSPLSRAVETVSTKFSSLEIMAVTALANITNSAVNAGKRIVSALTIDPIKTGFNEYETKINAVQTIMSNTASKGTTMADVTAVLDDLNTYADKTIYNFAEMTRNIGTFTAAGVSLEESASAIKGIANLAAASGSNSQQASTAMYQLSQALAAGTVKLMDWNSVVNAGMGGEKFQEALKATAREHGIAVDEIIKANGSFRESLREGWISADILNETLSKFTVEGATKYAQAMMESGKWTESQAEALIKEANAMEDAATKVKTFTQLWDTMKESAQSGWAQTWEIIIGDFEEAKESLTEISDLFGNFLGSSADSRNNVLQNALTSSWKQLSKEIVASGVDVDDFKNRLVETGIEHGKITQKMIDDAGGFEKSLKTGWASPDMFSEVFNSYASGMEGVSQSTDETIEKLEYFQKIVNEIWYGDYNNGKERVEALTNAGYDYATVQDLVNKTIDGHKLTLEDLNVAQMANLGFTESQIKVLSNLADQAEKTGTPINELINNLTRPSGRELLMGSLTNSIKALLKVLDTVKKSWHDAFSIDEGKIYNFVSGLNKFTESLIMSGETADKFKSTLDGLLAILDIITTITGGGLKFAIKTLCEILGLADVDILSITASAGDAIANFRDWLFETNALAKGFEKFISGLKNGLASVKEWIKTLLNKPEVQSAISNFGAAFSKIFENIKKYLSGGLDRIRDFIGRIKEIDSLSLDNIKKALQDFKDNVIDYFSNLDLNFDNISEAFNNFKDRISECLSDMGIDFDDLKKKLNDFLGFVKSQIPTVIAVGMGAILIAAIAKISDVLSLLASPLEGISKLIFKVGKALKKFVNSLSGLARSLSFAAVAEGIKNIAIAIGILAAAVAVLSQIDNQGNVWSSVGAISVLVIVVGGVVAGLMALMNQLAAVEGNLLKASGAIALLSVSLLLLVGCLAILEKLDPGLALMNSIILVSLVASLIGLTKMINKMDKGLDGSAKGLLALSASLLILSIAVSRLGGMKVSTLIKGITAVGLLTSFCAGLIAMSKFAGENVGKAGASILAISAAMLIMTMVIKQIGKLDGSAIVKGITVIGLLSAFCGGLMAMSEFAGTNAHKAGFGILAISAAMVLLVQVIKMVDKLNIAALVKGTAVIGAFSGFCAALIAVTKYAGKHAAKAGAAMLLISGSILILVGAIHLLKDVPIEGLSKAVAAIGIIMGMFASLIAATYLAKKCKSTLIILTVAIGILVGSIAALSSLVDSSKLSNASKSLSMLIGVFSLLIAATSMLKGANWAKNMGTIIVLTIVVGALATIISMLAELEAGSAIESAAALSLLVIALSASIAILSAIGTNIKDAIAGVIALTTMFAPLIAFVGVLAAMQNVKNALENAIILTGLATAMTVLLIPLMGIGAIIAASGGLAALGIAALLAMAIPLIAFVGVLAAMQNVKNALKNTIALTTLATAMTALLIPLTLIGALGPSALIGVTSLTLMAIPLLTFVAVLKNIQGVVLAYSNVLMLINLMDALSDILIKVSLVAPLALVGVTALMYLSEFIIAMGVVITSIGALVTEFPKLEEFLDKGIDMFEKLASGLGSIIGSFISGFGSVITSGLPSIAEDLSTFMDDIQPFIDGASGIKEEAISGVNNLVQMILALTGAGLVEQITDFLTGGKVSLSSFSEQLSSFGEGIKSFADEVSDIDIDSVTAAAKAATAIAKVAENIPETGGLINKLTGTKDINLLIDQLAPFGEGMKGFADAVSGIDSKSITSAAKAASSLTDVINNLPTSGGLAGLFTGEKDLEIFSEQLIPFGEGLKGFSISVAGIDNDAISSAADAASSLTEVIGNLPTSGGLKDLLVGKIDAQLFNEQLMPFGSGLKSFGDEVSGIDLASIENASSAASALESMFKALPKEGGVSGWFSGEVNLSGLSDNLAKFGESLSGYADAVSDIDDDDITAITDSVKAVNALKTVFKAMPKDGGIGGWFTGDTNLESIATNLVPFAKAIKEYANEVSGIDEDDIENIEKSSSAAEAIRIVLAELPKEGGVPGWFSGYTDLGTLSSGLVSFADAIVTYSDSVADIDVDSINNSATAASSIADAIGSFPKHEGLAQWFSGEIDISKITGDIVPFAQALKDYCTTVYGINTDGALASVAVAGSIARAISSFPRTEGMAQWIAGEIDIDSITDAIPAIAQAIKSYCDIVYGLNSDGALTANAAALQIANAMSHFGSLDLNDIDLGELGSQITSFGQALKDFSSIVYGIDSNSIAQSIASINTLATANISGMATAFSNVPSKLEPTLKGMVSSMITTLSNSSNEFETVGIEYMDALAESISSGSSNVITSITTSLTNCIGAMNASYGGFYSAGSYVASGFAEGIAEGQFEAISAAVSMATSAYEAAKKALDINSPSKVFSSLAMSVPEGFADGIYKMQYLVEDSATSMTSKAVDSAKKALSSFNKMGNSNDRVLSIRPVVDMSDINANGGKYLTSVEAKLEPVKSLAQVMSESQVENTKSNMQLLTAINGLREDIALANERDDKEISLYIDSKKMASTIAKPMNKQLKVLVSRGAY